MTSATNKGIPLGGIKVENEVVYEEIQEKGKLGFAPPKRAEELSFSMNSAYNVITQNQ